MRVNTDFLISPAYRVPPMSTSPRVRLRATKVSDRVPWRSGSALQPGRHSTVKAGWPTTASTPSGRRNRCRLKRLCQASSVITRTDTR